MYIFIDESGSFCPVPSASSSASVVGALVVPSHKLDHLLARYERLRQGLKKDRSGEVKGKLLGEADVIKVCDLLYKNNCIFEAVAIDMAWETQKGIEAHVAGQSEAITKHLTPEHQPGMIEGVWAWRRSLESMPLPLYVQSTVTFEVLAAVIAHAPLYYAQRSPKELADFHWVVDGKDVNKVTSAEKWWSDTMLPMLQSRSQREPFPAVEGADFSAFDRKFLMETPDYLKAHGFDENLGIDLRRLMKDSFRFSSAPEPGLELVDIVTNATRRALQGNLQFSGWCRVPRLMIHRRGQYLRLVHLTERPSDAPPPPYSKIVTRGFARVGRNMLTDSMLQSA